MVSLKKPSLFLALSWVAEMALTDRHRFAQLRNDKRMALLCLRNQSREVDFRFADIDGLYCNKTDQNF